MYFITALILRKVYETHTGFLIAINSFAAISSKTSSEWLVRLWTKPCQIFITIVINTRRRPAKTKQYAKVYRPQKLQHTPTSKITIYIAGQKSVNKTRALFNKCTPVHNVIQKGKRTFGITQTIYYVIVFEKLNFIKSNAPPAITSTTYPETPTATRDLRRMSWLALPTRAGIEIRAHAS